MLVFDRGPESSLPQLTTHHNLVYRVPPHVLEDFDVSCKDLALGVAVGSSTQIALLVVPFSVIVVGPLGQDMSRPFKGRLMEYSAMPSHPSDFVDGTDHSKPFFAADLRFSTMPMSLDFRIFDTAVMILSVSAAAI